jgi:DNA-binding Lrp family transcriptional regulator
VDPRVTPTDIARTVGLSRTAVQARLRAWRQSGLYLGQEVWPNPQLFGARLCTIDIPCPDATDVRRLLDDLALVDGMVSARVLMDDDGRTIRAYLADLEGRSGARQRRVAQRVLGLEEELRGEPYWLPEPTIAPSNLDWRILRYYRAFPDELITAASSDLDVSQRTLTARRERLLSSRSIWWLLTMQGRRFPVVSFYLTLRERGTGRDVQRSLAARFCDWIPCADGGFGLPPATPGMIAGLSWVDSPSAIDEIASELSTFPGVGTVRWRIPMTFRSYPEWFDQLLEARSPGFSIPPASDPRSTHGPLEAGPPTDGSDSGPFVSPAHPAPANIEPTGGATAATAGAAAIFWRLASPRSQKRPIP